MYLCKEIISAHKNHRLLSVGQLILAAHFFSLVWSTLLYRLDIMSVFTSSTTNNKTTYRHRRVHSIADQFPWYRLRKWKRLLPKDWFLPGDIIEPKSQATKAISQWIEWRKPSKSERRSVDYGRRNLCLSSDEFWHQTISQTSCLLFFSYPPMVTWVPTFFLHCVKSFFPYANKQWVDLWHHASECCHVIMTIYQVPFLNDDSYQ